MVNRREERHLRGAPAWSPSLSSQGRQGQLTEAASVCILFLDVMKGDHGGIPQHALVMKLVHMLYPALLLQNRTVCLGLEPGADTHGPNGPTWTLPHTSAPNGN